MQDIDRGNTGQDVIGNCSCEFNGSNWMLMGLIFPRSGTWNIINIRRGMGMKGNMKISMLKQIMKGQMQVYTISKQNGKSHGSYQ